MFAEAVLFGCLADPAAPGEFSRAAALDLHKRGCLVEAGEHMAEVYRQAKDPNERRAAAAFVVGAYGEAFRTAPDQAAAAELLCRGLAIADNFMATTRGVAATHLVAPRAKLAALREPFGECAPVEGLLPVVTTGRRPRPTQTQRPVAESVPQLPVTSDTPPGRAMLWTGVGVTAVGAGVAAVGLGLGLSRATAAAEGADALTAGAPGRGFTANEKLMLQDLRGELSNARVILGTVVGVGAAMLVTGAVLTAVGMKRRGPQRAALAPWGRGVAFVLRF